MHNCSFNSIVGHQVIEMQPIIIIIKYKKILFKRKKMFLMIKLIKIKKKIILKMEEKKELNCVVFAYLYIDQIKDVQKDIKLIET